MKASEVFSDWGVFGAKLVGQSPKTPDLGAARLFLRRGFDMMRGYDL